MADHEKGWYIVTKTKRLTNREKQEKVAVKKQFWKLREERKRPRTLKRVERSWHEQRI